MIRIRKCFILFTAMIAAAGIGCKKNMHGGGSAPPPIEKKAIVSTIAGDGTDALQTGLRYPQNSTLPPMWPLPLTGLFT